MQAFGKGRGKKCEEEACSCTREVFGVATCASALNKPEAEAEIKQPCPLANHSLIVSICEMEVIIFHCGCLKD